MEQQTERKRGAGAKQAYDVLRDEILDLILAPGSLVDEVALAERFKMSRTPIREALVRLAGEGLIVTLPNRSTLVAQIDYLNMHTYFDALILMYRVTSRLAAQHRVAGDLSVIKERHDAYAAAVLNKDALAMISTNVMFHMAIAEAGRNQYFTGLFKRLLDEGRRILRLYYQSFDEQFPQRFEDEHGELVAAIQDGNVEKADEVALKHAEQIVEQVKRFLDRGKGFAIKL